MAVTVKLFLFNSLLLRCSLVSGRDHDTHDLPRQNFQPDAVDEKGACLIQGSVSSRKQVVTVIEGRRHALEGRPPQLVTAATNITTVQLESLNDNTTTHSRATVVLLELRGKYADLLRTMALYAIALLLISVVAFLATARLGLLSPPEHFLGDHAHRQSFAADKAAYQINQNPQIVKQRHSGQPVPPAVVAAAPYVSSPQRMSTAHVVAAPQSSHTTTALVRPSTYASQPPGGVMATPLPSGHLQQQVGRVSVQPSARITIPPVVREEYRTSLCSELVVPDGSECTLLLPRLPPTVQGDKTNGQVTVDDAHGAPVFRASYVLGNQTRGNKRLILSSATDASVFGFCRDCESASTNGVKQLGVIIHHHDETAFGVLRSESFDGASGYAVVTRLGSRVQFRGDIRAGNVTITDEHGRLLGVTQHAGPKIAGKRSLRIGPNVDAGLVAIAALSIDLLEHEAATRK